MIYSTNIEEKRRCFSLKKVITKQETWELSRKSSKLWRNISCCLNRASSESKRPAFTLSCHRRMQARRNYSWLSNLCPNGSWKAESQYSLISRLTYKLTLRRCKKGKLPAYFPWTNAKERRKYHRLSQTLTQSHFCRRRENHWPLGTSSAKRIFITRKKQDRNSQEKPKWSR